MSHRYLQFMFAATLMVLISGCKKDKENAAVVEEVPAAAPKETDTSATLAEEPNLQQVGKDKPGSAKNTFHPGKGKGKGAAPSAAASEAGFSDAGHFVVQVAIFKSKKQAAALVEKLSGQGYPAYVAEVSDPVPQLSGTYHRVRIGKFLKIADAKAFGDNTLKPLGYDYWVDNKKNDGVGGTGGGVSTPTNEPASTPAEAAPSAAAPAPHKGKKAKAVAAEPAEPSTPPNGTWGAPKSDEPAPTSDSWSNTGAAGTPAAKPADKPAAASSELPGTKPTPAAAESAPAAAASSAPAPATAPKAAGKADTGKVNLDEW